MKESLVFLDASESGFCEVYRVSKLMLGRSFERVPLSKVQKNALASSDPIWKLPSVIEQLVPEDSSLMVVGNQMGSSNAILAMNAIVWSDEAESPSAMKLIRQSSFARRAFSRITDCTSSMVGFEAISCSIAICSVRQDDWPCVPWSGK